MLAVLVYRTVHLGALWGIFPGGQISGPSSDNVGPAGPYNGLVSSFDPDRPPCRRPKGTSARPGLGSSVRKRMDLKGVLTKLTLEVNVMRSLS